MDLMTCLSPSYLGRLSFVSCGPFCRLSFMAILLLVSFGFCPLTLLITPVMHKQIPFVLPLSSMKHHWGAVCAKSDVALGAPKASGACAAFSET